MNGVLLNVDVENSTRQKLTMNRARDLWADANCDGDLGNDLQHHPARVSLRCVCEPVLYRSTSLTVPPEGHGCNQSKNLPEHYFKIVTVLRPEKNYSGKQTSASIKTLDKSSNPLGWHTHTKWHIRCRPGVNAILYGPCPGRVIPDGKPVLRR